MKDLILINDKAVRLKAFAEAEKLIKKLDRIEDDLKSFYDQDQRLFSNWFDLSFREQRQNLSGLHIELRELVKFHNWLIAVVKIKDISMPEAFVILRAEELQYQNGSAEIRAWIEEERRLRDEFILQEMRAGSESLFEENEDDEATKETPPPRDEEEEIIFTELQRMSNKKIQTICKDRESAFRLLGMALTLIRTDEEKTLFLRIWDFVPRQYQDSFAMHFTKETGTSLKRVIEEMRDDVENFNPHSQKKAAQTESAQEQKSAPKGPEALKLLYRKIVRRLHPDLQANQQEPSLWQKKMWNRVQTAHQKQDHQELDKLLRLVLIRSRDLQELTLAEILESQTWLEEELELINGEAKELKQQPAWGFSRKKSYEALKRKLEKSLRQEMQPLEDQVHELKSEHAMLELLAKAGQTKRDRRREHQGRRSIANRAPGYKDRSFKQRSFFD